MSKLTDFRATWFLLGVVSGVAMFFAFIWIMFTILGA
jgi:hypothetical protein